MTVTAAPLPGVTSIANITDWESLLGTGLVSGVQAGQLNGLVPSLDATGRNAVIGTGKALLRGFFYETDAAVSTAIPAASGQNRIDRLVLRLNRAASTATTFIVPTVITGTAGANPQEPALTQTPTGLWDLPIMSWQSSSNGALTALSDERYFGAAVLSGVSTARPAMTGPGLLIETDTSRVALWTGSAWAYVSMIPDNWHTITNFAANGWSGTFSYTQISPGLVSLAVNIALAGSATVADATQICSVSSRYAPASYKQIPMRTDALKVSGSTFESAALSIRADGSVVVYGVGLAATLLTGTGSYPLAI